MTTVEPRNLRPLTATLVARYAERFNAVFADGELAVTSPLGAAFAWHGIPVFSAWIAEPSEADG
jgi:hypothetical protein